MGSIQVEDSLDQGQPNGDSPKSFEIAGLGADNTSATGLKEEIILLSWFIALLRTRENSQVSYEWAYGGGDSPKRLAMEELKIGLQSSVEEAAVAVSEYIATVATAVTDTSGSTSLILSNDSLSQTAEAKDEVSCVFRYLSSPADS
jgi:hypothetical protein